MQFMIIPLENNFKIHKIERSISKIFKLKPELISLFNLLNICCLDDNNQIVIIYNNPKSGYCLYCDQKLSDAYIYLIKNIFNKKDIDIELGYHLLLIAEELKLELKLFYKILDYINWPLGEKGINYFISLKNFSQNLKEFVFNKKILLSDAYFFHEYFIKDYDKFLRILPENLTFTERNNVIRNLTEFAKKEKKSIDDIIELYNKSYNDKNKENIINFSNYLKYPKKSKYKEFLIGKINELKLPKGIDIYFDDSFEREDYSIKIKFNNFLSLFNKIKQIKKLLENYFSKNDFIDFFDHDNLFKNHEKKEK